ncbi:MAG: hypothetical protein KF689_08200 [Gemmatimonadaceae bacterium]|nr:hypothetical protein [Gemmatimonadaceae bacterium]MCW5827418.1 hypothetical protein [Gemmatimonadaceae bacterium]
MQTDRRQFLGKVASGAMAVGGVGLGLAAMPDTLGAAMPLAADASRDATWDMQWAARLSGRVRTVFDVPEVESGYGVWRASIWEGQYSQLMGIPAAEFSTALVLRHNAIVLAMRQSAWDRYGLAELSKATHPVDDKPTTRNPALLGVQDGLGEPHVSFALPEFMRRGGVVLACDLALSVIAGHMAGVDGVPPAEAKDRAIAALVPGVVLQPSGVLAVLHAQRAAGALYIRAS